jgi:molecular chaperone DnaK
MTRSRTERISNGRPSVPTAQDTATGKDQKITITASSGLSEAEIQKMVREASDHEAADKVQREQVERRNRLDNLCYSAEKALHDSRDKLQASDITSLEAAIKDGRGAIDKQDDALVTSLSERLEKEAQRVASAMQRGPKDAGAGGEARPTPDAEDSPQGRTNIQDAEFEETATP